MKSRGADPPSSLFVDLRGRFFLLRTILLQDGVDARLLEKALHLREAVVAVRAARLDGHKADVEVGAVAVADLKDELGVLAEGRRLVNRDLGVGPVRSLLG